MDRFRQNLLRTDRWKTGLEILIVFAIFYIFGAWPVPDSNEPYYIGKAIHYWQPDWIPNDTFLETQDSHWTFYVTFGWLTFFLSPYGMAWAGRFITWGLLAWSWRRLSFALIPVRWTAPLTGLAMAYYVDSFHMAGEWILGGVEGKSFAFPFVFFGLEALVRGRWHRVWIFLGIASAFHVLVGGWSVLVAGFVLCASKSPGYLTKSPGRSAAQSGDYGRVRLSSPALWAWAGLFLGGAISLFGLVPALMLDHGASREIVHQAHQIYVFERLYHHLVPYMLPWTYLWRFFLLTLFWILGCRLAPIGGRRHCRFDLFVWGTLLLSLVGLIAAYGLRDDQQRSAEILRFYWFRLSDVAVPMGVAIGATSRLLRLLRHYGITRRQKPISLPRFPDVLFLLGLPFAIYLLSDQYFFGRRLYFSNIVAEPCVPWALTLILCWIVLWVKGGRGQGAGCRNSKNQFPPAPCTLHPAPSPSPSPYIFWGLTLLYGAVVFYAPLDSLKNLGDTRTYFNYARTEPGRAFTAYHWIEACRWISDPQNTQKTDKFWVPREGATFKWHARRSDIGVWKDVPQDAEGIVAWHRTMKELFSYRDEEGNVKWDRSLTILLWWTTPERIEQLRQTYGFNYIVCARYPDLSHHAALEMVYENDIYRIYHVSPLKTTE